MAGELERLLIRIEADTAILRKAMQDAEKQVAGFSSAVDKNLERSERRFRSFNTAGRKLFAGLSAAYLIRETGQLADTYTNMTNRLKFVTSSSAELEAVQRRLFEISQDTRQGLSETTELYSRMAFALRDAGVSQNEVLKFTENLNKALALSGAAGAEASGALIQLSQGLASGTLRGQELNSILEQTPYIASLIATELGVSTGELRKLGEQGKITGPIVFKAITNANDLSSKFAESTPTLAQGFITINNSLLNFVGHLNEATGAGTGTARVLMQMADAIDRMGKQLPVVGKSVRELASRGPIPGVAGGVATMLFGSSPTPADTGWEATITPNLDEKGENKQGAAGAGFDNIQKQLEQLRIQALEANNLQFEAQQAQYEMELQVWQDHLDKKLITLEQFEQARKNLQAVSNRRRADADENMSDAMLDQVKATGSAIFGENKKWAIAEAAIDTYKGVTKALGAFPPPYNFAMAALVAAQGFAQVAAIRSTSGGSSGGAAGVFGAPAAASLAASNDNGGSSSGSSSGSTRTINVTLVGRSYDREQVRELIEGLNEAIADGARLYVS